MFYSNIFNLIVLVFFSVSLCIFCLSITSLAQPRILLQLRTAEELLNTNAIYVTVCSIDLALSILILTLHYDVGTINITAL